MFGFILSILTGFYSIIGIIGFYTGNYFLLYSAFALVIIELIYGLLSGELKGLTTEYVALIFAFILIYNNWNWKIAIALCFCYEEAIIFFISIFMLKIFNKNK